MTKSKKLGLLVCAMAINAVGMATLAQPARAMSILECTPVQSAYAAGFAQAQCNAEGYKNSYVTSCTQGGGTYSFNFGCY